MRQISLIILTIVICAVLADKATENDIKGTATLINTYPGTPEALKAEIKKAVCSGAEDHNEQEGKEFVEAVCKQLLPTAKLKCDELKTLIAETLKTCPKKTK